MLWEHPTPCQPGQAITRSQTAPAPLPRPHGHAWPQPAQVPGRHLECPVLSSRGGPGWVQGGRASVMGCVTYVCSRWVVTVAGGLVLEDSALRARWASRCQLHGLGTQLLLDGWVCRSRTRPAPGTWDLPPERGLHASRRHMGEMSRDPRGGRCGATREPTESGPVDPDRGSWGASLGGPAQGSDGPGYNREGQMLQPSGHPLPASPGRRAGRGPTIAN